MELFIKEIELGVSVFLFTISVILLMANADTLTAYRNTAYGLEKKGEIIYVSDHQIYDPGFGSGGTGNGGGDTDP